MTQHTSATDAKRAVFFDRDGTLIEDVDYLTSADMIRLLPGVPEALRRLRSAGLLLSVATNQSAVARGWLTEQELVRIHAALQQMLSTQGAWLDDFFFCPHLPEGTVERYAIECDCRKPAPGLLREAAAKWNLELSRCFVVGDKERDVEAGRRAGCRTILLDPSQGRGTEADFAAADIGEAAELILGELGKAPLRKG